MAFAAAHPIVTAFLASGLGLEAYGQYQQGQSAAAAAKYNALVSQRQAEAAKRTGEITKNRLERQRRLMLGKQKSLYAKAGVLMKGSPLEVLADTASQYDIDLALNDYNTKLGVGNYDYMSQYYNQRATNAKRAGYIAPASTLLTGIGTLGSFK